MRLGSGMEMCAHSSTSHTYTDSNATFFLLQTGRIEGQDRMLNQIQKAHEHNDATIPLTGSAGHAFLTAPLFTDRRFGHDSCP